MIGYQEELYKAKSIRSRQCREIPEEVCAFILARNQNSIYEWNMGQYTLDLRLMNRHASLAFYALGASSHNDSPIVNDELMLSEELSKHGVTDELLTHFREQMIPIWRHARNVKHEYNRHFIHANNGRLLAVIYPMQWIHYINNLNWEGNTSEKYATFVMIPIALLKIIGAFFAAIIGAFVDFFTMRYFSIEEYKNGHRRAMAEKYPELLTAAREEKVNDMLEEVLRRADESGVLEECKKHGIEAKLISGSSEHWVPVSASMGKSDIVNLTAIGEPKTWCAYNFTGIALMTTREKVAELKSSKRPLLLHRGATLRALNPGGDMPLSTAFKRSMAARPTDAGAPKHVARTSAVK